jgi:hypothetical protein
MANVIFGIAVIALIIVLVVFLRKRLIALAIDVVVGTLLYFAILFIIAFFDIITIPVVIADWGYPILLIAFIAYHIYSNLNLSNRRYSSGQASWKW